MNRQEKARHNLKRGSQYPFDANDRWQQDHELNTPGPPATDWAHAASRGIVYDMCDRGGIKNGFYDIEEEIRAEIVESIADIIREASEMAAREGMKPVQTTVSPPANPRWRESTNEPPPPPPPPPPPLPPAWNIAEYGGEAAGAISDSQYKSSVLQCNPEEDGCRVCSFLAKELTTTNMLEVIRVLDEKLAEAEKAGRVLSDAFLRAEDGRVELEKKIHGAGEK